VYRRAGDAGNSRVLQGETRAVSFCRNASPRVVDPAIVDVTHSTALLVTVVVCAPWNCTRDVSRRHPIGRAGAKNASLPKDFTTTTLPIVMDFLCCTDAGVTMSNDAPMRPSRERF
jgi:hypothetical protein